MSSPAERFARARRRQATDGTRHPQLAQFAAGLRQFGEADQLQAGEQLADLGLRQLVLADLRGQAADVAELVVDPAPQHADGVAQAFAEGVDLPGTRLIGAFIATLGLPQVNPINEHMLAQMAQRFGKRKAYDYTYLYPGLRKVVQAAGRVIRTEQDQGLVVLMDDRYQRAQVRALLPGWWGMG